MASTTTGADGSLRAAQESGQLALTAGQLSDWWQPLQRAQERGQFFASFTGFVVGVTQP